MSTVIAAPHIREKIGLTCITLLPVAAAVVAGHALHVPAPMKTI